MSKKAKPAAEKKTQPTEFTSRDLVMVCAQAAIDKKANHSLIYEVGKLDAFTDYFLITGGANERQVQAIADEIVAAAKKSGIKRVIVEGYDEGRWILADLGGVVVHIFQDFIREFYDLETFWAEAPRLPIPQEFYLRPTSGTPVTDTTTPAQD